MHSRDGKNVKVLIPASGLVTALEPILRACDGTWIANGSGDADREVAVVPRSTRQMLRIQQFPRRTAPKAKCEASLQRLAKRKRRQWLSNPETRFDHPLASDHSHVSPPIGLFRRLLINCNVEVMLYSGRQTSMPQSPQPNNLPRRDLAINNRARRRRTPRGNT